MKTSFFRKIQRMVSRRKWLLIVLFLPLFLPLETTKQYYKVVTKLQLSIPDYISSHGDRMKWMATQIGILHNRGFVQATMKKINFSVSEINNYLPEIMNGLDIVLEGENRITIEIISTKKEKMKRVASAMAAEYLDKLLSDTRSAYEQINKTQQDHVRQVDDELKDIRSKYTAAKVSYEAFLQKMTPDNTAQLSSEVDELRARFLEAKVLYTAEHPQVRDLQGQFNEKLRQLENKQAIISQENKKEVNLKEAYFRYEEAYSGVLKKYDVLKSSTAEFKIRNVGKVVSGPRVIDVGLIETKVIDIAGKLFLGIVAMLTLGLLTEGIDKTIWNESEIIRDLGIKTLGTIPRPTGRSKSKFLIDFSKTSEMVKSFEALRSNIQFINLVTPLKSILYCSFLPGGEDLFAGNLAIAMTLIGGRVGLINATRKQEKYNHLLPPEKQDCAIHPSHTFIMNETTIKNLKILTIKDLAGLDKKKSDETINSVKNEFDVIIIDSPPISESVNVAALSSVADAVILGVKAKRTKREFILRNYTIFKEVNARVLGVILQW